MPELRKSGKGRDVVDGVVRQVQSIELRERGERSDVDQPTVDAIAVFVLDLGRDLEAANGKACER
jgi:hypothetical protein